MWYGFLCIIQIVKGINMKVEKAKEILVQSKSFLEEELHKVMSTERFSYRTFGTDIEPHVIRALKTYLIKSEIPEKNIKTAETKNDFPDILLTLDDGLLAADIKSGNHYKKTGSQWGTCNNSNNDLGTINSWPDKIDKFGGENIYFVFVEYSINDTLHQLNRVTIAPFYKFLEINPDGVMKYREKDGNLRPKNFNALSKLDSYGDFVRLFRATEIFRAKRIIKKHYQTLPEEDKKAIIDELRGN